MEQESLSELAGRLQTVCLARGVSLATAESCTGGLIAKLITDVAGSSGYFRGGVVAYANSTKERLLGVTAELLSVHGAVSAQVARAMAQAVAAGLGSDLGVAVTGISGPGGGSEAKPVGLTYVAVVHPGGIDVRRYLWTGDRAANREATARVALEMLVACAAAAAEAPQRAAGGAPQSEAEPT